jgi:hypothetical protein
MALPVLETKQGKMSGRRYESVSSNSRNALEGGEGREGATMKAKKILMY